MSVNTVSRSLDDSRLEPESPASIAGLPPGVCPGPAHLRFVAQLVDSGLAPLLLAAALTLQHRSASAPALVSALVAVAVGWIGLVWWLLATRATAPAAGLLGLQVVGLDDGRPLGWSRVAVRSGVLWLLRMSLVGAVAMAVAQRRHPRGQGWHDLAVDSLVILRRRAPLAPRSGAPGPASPGQAETADLVPATADFAAEPTRSTALSGPQARSRARTWSVVLDDGRRLALDAVHLIGRNPTPEDGEEARLVVLSDPTRTVSQTHLELGVMGGTAYVRDRGSTNGSTVTTALGEAMACPPGQAVPVGAGALVTFGDHHLRVREGADHS